MHNTDGGKTDFYDIGDCKDVDDLANHWQLNFFEGNILKALVGMAKARKGVTRHKGTSYDRDLNKAKHYIEKLYKLRYSEGEECSDKLYVSEEYNQFMDNVNAFITAGCSFEEAYSRAKGISKKVNT